MKKILFLASFILISIGVFAQFSVTISSSTNVTCNGGSNGDATTTVTAGITPYSYLWTPGNQTTPNAVGLSAGTYTVIVVDVQQDSVTANVIITEPTAVSASAGPDATICAGESTSIGGTSFGGTTPYTYYWTPSTGLNSTTAANPTASPTNSSTYSLIVTDANGCTGNDVLSLTVNAAPSATITSSNNVTCNGQCNGSINLTVSGGTAPYSYIWNNASSTEDLSGLCVGNYTVTVSDANSCTATTSLTITQPVALSVTVSKTDASCNGCSDGTATATASGGTTQYSYNWSSGESTPTITGKPAGIYTVTVTDANGCTANGSATITEPVAATITVSSPNGGELWAAGSSQTITWTSTGGISIVNLWYSIDGGSTWNFIDSVSNSGSFNWNVPNPPTTQALVKISDSSNPSTFDVSNSLFAISGLTTITVTSPNGGESWTVSSSHNITWTSSGGISNVNILYSTNNGSTFTSIASFQSNSGTYTWTVPNNPSTNCLVKVEDANNPATVDASDTTFVISPVCNLTLTDSTGNASCGANNGFAMVFSSGGATPYTYLWSNGNTNNNINNLSAGIYSVTVTDAAACSAIDTVIISSPEGISASIASTTNASCYGCSDGSTTATATGGTTPYEYLWSNSASTATISNLPAGNYTVTVTDVFGCSSAASTTITQPVSCVANTAVPYTQTFEDTAFVPSNWTNVNPNSNLLTWVHANVGGFGSSSWSAKIDNWNLGTSIGEIDELISPKFDLSTESAWLTFDVASARYDSANFDQLKVFVTVDCSNWTEIYNKAGTTLATAPDNINQFIPSSGQWRKDSVDLASYYGNASVQFKFQNITGYGNVLYLDNINVASPSGTSSPTASFSPNDTSFCSGVAISYTDQSSGTPTSWSWSFSGGIPSSSTQQNPSVTFSTPGTYSVMLVATNANGSDTAIGSVTVNPGPTPTISGTTTICAGNTTTLTVSGGISFLWGTGATTNSIIVSSSGTYSVTATNPSGCTGIASATVTVSTPVSVSTSVTNASCNGCSDGSATATASGGSSPYSYLWTNSATTPTITGLSAGNYSITVTDANGCTDTDSLTITQPTGTAPTASFTNSSTAICSGTPVNFTDQSTGIPTSWSWTFSGGTPSTSSQQNPSVTYTSSGTYSVMLIVYNTIGSDTATANVNVTVNAGPSVTTSFTNATCNGCSNGSASVTASGGTTPYSYLWSNAATSASLSGLIAGTYSVTVTDTTGCTANGSVTISEPAALSVTVAGNNPTCSNGNNGNALASVSGGTSPYTYQWSNGKVTSLIGNLQAGTYTVTVTDAGGSTATANITLTAPAAINLSFSALDASCGSANGLASVSASGGSTPYTYLWSNGQTSSIASNLTAGMYTVTVTAANGCKAVGSTTVNTSSGFAVSFTGTNITCNGANDGIATAAATGGSTPYTYQWSNGGTSASITGLGAGTYSATVTDNSGCSIPGTVNISQPSSMVLALNGNNVSSCGSSNGAINLTATGGTAPYTFLWSNSATSEDLSGLVTGTYTVTVTDTNGCTKTKGLAITAPSAATLTLNSNNVSCYGACDGIAIAIASGGNSPYTYSWSNGKTGYAVTGMCAGTYTVTAVESGGCSVSGSVTVTQPTALSVIASATAATCGVSNGTLSSSATGGTTPYSYQWSSGDTTATADSLTSGIYLVTVTDANGCNNFGMATISNGGAPTLTVNSVTNVMCNGASNGAIDITASGAATPFSYAWSNGATTQDNSNLSAGPYEVTVTNTNNCVSVQSINVSQPDALVLSVSLIDASCGNADGGAGVTVSGGTTPYSYAWSNSSTTAQISNLSSQIYAVTVTDSKGCSKIAAAAVGEVGGPTVTLDSVVSAGCNGTGSVFVSVAEGVPPYTFNWDNGSVNEDLLGVNEGSYGLIVSDINGCSGAISASIASQQISTDPICLMTVDTITGTNKVVWQKTYGSGIASYKIYRETTQSGVFQAVGTVPFDSLSVFTDPVANPLIHSWRYKISALDSCGNESPKSNEHKTMHVTINLGLGGTINLIWDHYQGFAYPTYYIYRFKPQTGWTLLDSLASNTTSYTDYYPPTFYGLQYFVEARHPDGCFATKSVENHNSSRSNRTSAAMPAPNDLLADTLVTDATQGNCDGEATVIASGGITPYAYVWNTTPIQTTATATGLCAGDYQVTVTDSEGDMALVDVTVSTIIGVESKTEDALSLRIYPNPVREEMNLVVNTSSSQKMNIVLVNTLGQEDVIYNGRMEKGETNLKFDTGILSAGVYYLKIVAGEGKPEYMRFVKGR